MGPLEHRRQQFEPDIEAEVEGPQGKNQGRGTSKNAIKNEILMLKLTIDDMTEWADRSVSTIERLSVVEEATRAGEWLYFGELEQKLGHKEASEHIAMGKYEEGKDHQGAADLGFNPESLPSDFRILEFQYIQNSMTCWPLHSLESLFRVPCSPIPKGLNNTVC